MEQEAEETLTKDRQHLLELQEQLSRQDLATFDHQANVHLIMELLEVAYRLHKASAKQDEDPMKNGLVELHRKLRRGRLESRLPSDSSLPLSA
jgi:hypothetical protein